jgi:beta-lactamase regulating signal transducer with metallopeptidase domain
MTESMHVAGWTLVSFLWQGALIAAVAAISLRLASRAASVTRYAISCAALAAMLAAPVVTIWWLQTSEASAPLVGFDRPFVGMVAAAGGAGAARPATSVAPPGPTQWFPLLVALWLAGVAALTARTAWGWLRIRQLHHGALSAPPSRWQATVDRLAASFGIDRRVHVADCERLDAPAVIGWIRPVILVPVAALSHLSIAQVEAILAHELAHIRRHDYLVNTLQTVAETLLFYHPAVWWLSSRLRLEREHCCDDVAVSICGDAFGYAEALAAIEARRSVPAFAMAAAGGSLVGRIRRILGVSAPAPSLTGWIVAPVLAGILTAGAVALAQVQPAAPAALRPPAAPSAPSAPADPASAPDVSRGREFRLQSNDFSRQLDIRGRGGLTFSGDLTDIVAMDDGAYLTIRHRNWLTIRSIEIRGERGAISRRFYVSGVEQPWDPEGRRWLADRLPPLVRRAGFGVESRTRRILSASGVTGVLEEITRLDSDYVRRLYYRELFRIGSLDADETARVVARAGQDIRSDYELRQTLEAALPLVTASPAAVRAYVDATTSMTSGYEHRQALDTLARADGLASGAAGPLAQSAARIRSDYEKRQALSTLLPMTLDAESMRAVLDAAATISSDYECATLLAAFVEAHSLDGVSAAEFFEAAETIGSDYERGRVLKAAARRQPLPPAVLQGIFASVRTMQSDYEQAQVLLAVVKTNGIDATSRPAFLAAADAIHSDYEQTRVLAALVRAEPR